MVLGKDTTGNGNTGASTGTGGDGFFDAGRVSGEMTGRPTSSSSAPIPSTAATIQGKSHDDDSDVDEQLDAKLQSSLASRDLSPLQVRMSTRQSHRQSYKLEDDSEFGFFDFTKWRPNGRSFPPEDDLVPSVFTRKAALLGCSTVLTSWTVGEGQEGGAVVDGRIGDLPDGLTEEEELEEAMRCPFKVSEGAEKDSRKLQGTRKRWVICNPWCPDQFLLFFRHPPTARDIALMQQRSLRLRQEGDIAILKSFHQPVDELLSSLPG